MGGGPLAGSAPAPAVVAHHAEASGRAVAALHARRRAAEDAARTTWPATCDLAEVARNGDDRLWSRRPEAGAFPAPVGLGEVPWSPPVTETTPLAPRPAPADGLVDDGPGVDDVGRALAATSTLREVPVEVSLEAGTTIGICGPPAAATAAARALVAHLVVAHGPSDLGIVVPDDPEWDWLRWCPHASGASDGATQLRVVHGPDAAPPDEPGVATVALAADRARLPAACRSIVVVTAEGTAVVEVPARRQRQTGPPGRRAHAGHGARGRALAGEVA